jgi:hypothetical protein
MVTMTVLSMVVVVAILALVGFAVASRSTVHAARTGRQSDGGAGWTPAILSDGGSSDCGGGNAGCDGGGGGGGA